MRRKKKEEVGLFDWLLLSFALGLAAIVLYYGAQRWSWRGEAAVRQQPALPPPLPLGRIAASRSLATAVLPGPPGVSPSFQAVSSIPPMEISRTGRPTMRTKAPPVPKPAPDRK